VGQYAGWWWARFTQSAKFRAASVTVIIASLIESDYHVLGGVVKPKFVVTAFMRSSADSDRPDPMNRVTTSGRPSTSAEGEGGDESPHSKAHSSFHSPATGAGK